jgi:hypothetical protein
MSVIVLASCGRPPASSSPAGPGPLPTGPGVSKAEQSVTQVQGFEVTSTWHRKADLETFLGKLEAGSVDHISLNDDRPYVIVAVDVNALPEAIAKLDKGPIPTFRTTFLTAEGRELRQDWRPAADNKKLRYRALFVVRDSYTKVETVPLKKQ